MTQLYNLQVLVTSNLKLGRALSLKMSWIKNLATHGLVIALNTLQKMVSISAEWVAIMYHPTQENTLSICLDLVSKSFSWAIMKTILMMNSPVWILRIRWCRYRGRPPLSKPAQINITKFILGQLLNVCLFLKKTNIIIITLACFIQTYCHFLDGYMTFWYT